MREKPRPKPQRCIGICINNTPPWPLISGPSNEDGESHAGHPQLACAGHSGEDPPRPRSSEGGGYPQPSRGSLLRKTPIPQPRRAETLLRRSLVIREKTLGSNHEEVACNRNNLAALYQEQGRHAKADPLLQRSLAMMEKALGPNHPEVAKHLLIYAALIRKLNRISEAKAIQTTHSLRSDRRGLAHRTNG